MKIVNLLLTLLGQAMGKRCGVPHASTS